MLEKISYKKSMCYVFLVIFQWYNNSNTFFQKEKKLIKGKNEPWKEYILRKAYIKDFLNYPRFYENPGLKILFLGLL